MAANTAYEPVYTKDETNNTAEKTAYWHRYVPFLSSNGWSTEVFSAVLGTLLMVILFVVLEVYDGKPEPRFGSTFGGALTLNTVIAIISASVKAALLYAVAECVSQQKWFWFEKSYRQLSDMSTFDEASRGIWGGLELLWRTRFRSFASIGAFVMVLAIAIDPPSQQLISSADDRVPSRGLNSTVGIVTGWSDQYGNGSGLIQTTGSGTEAKTISTGMKGAVQLGLYSGGETVAELAPSCPGGNCTFEPYWSLAAFPRWYASEHHFIDGTGFTMMNMTSATLSGKGSGGLNSSNTLTPLRFDESVAFKDTHSPLADILLMYQSKPVGASGAYTSTFHAFEFVLEWCVQNFTTNVINGQATTTRHNALRNFEDRSNRLDGEISYKREGNVYDIAIQTHRSLQSYLAYLLHGYVGQKPVDYTFFGSSDPAVVLYQPFDDFSGDPPPNSLQGTDGVGLEHIINNVATAMTNYIRSKQGGSSTTHEGLILLNTTLVVVRWKWAVAHVIFTLSTLVLLFVTILSHHHGSLAGAGAWKSSSLAVLRALDPAISGKLGGIETASTAGQAHEAEVVILTARQGSGWRLSAKDELDTPVGEAG